MMSNSLSVVEPFKTVKEIVTDARTNKERELIYTTSRVVGSGSFGIVFDTKLVETEEHAAIKRVRQDKRFKNRELQIMRMVRHRNIVDLKAFFYSQGERVNFFSPQHFYFHSAPVCHSSCRLDKLLTSSN